MVNKGDGVAGEGEINEEFGREGVGRAAYAASLVVRETTTER